jgi:radical SAM protein with 4Fe4S-binding SPASM domain
LSLLTEEIAETLIKYDVEIATSLDGTKEGNDQVRLNKDLSGTYDQIIHGFDILKKLGHPIKSFAMTVTEKNFFDVDTKIIDWAASRNIEEVRIDIDVVGMVDIPVEDVVRKLTAVREYAKKLNILVDGFWSRSAENLGLIPEEEDIGFCGGERGNSACIAPSGQVFPCGYSNYQLGHYTELSTIHLNSEYQELLARRNLLKLEACKACPIFGFCRGGCLITKEANNSPEKNSYMCKLYIAMTEVIIRESVDD